ncbi:ABC transporter substrate-binding protein [Nocardia sp. NPDC127526]|uniref:ABC transporter substrate-binding protein n=1 Tax=Nocardia sp. NPDC127526 TaxID=3345393 RepID=UPI003639176B
MNDRFSLRAVLGAAAVALAVCGCSAPPLGAGEIAFGTLTAPPSGPLDSVTWMLPGEPTTFDTDIDSGAQENTVLANVCERLMEVQPDLTTAPRLAARADWVDDTHLVFTLRREARFHDGSPITADDVLWSMRRHARDEADESDEYTNVAGIEKTGDAQITVTMKQPDATFLQAMAGNGGVVWNPRVVQEQGDSFGTPSSPDACSGPYRLADWKPGTSVTLVKAENYWDANRVAKVERIVFTWADQSAVVNSLMSGDADGAFLGEPAAAVALRRADNVTLAQGPATNAWSLLTTGRGPARDERVRQALSLSLNRAGITKAAFGGLAQPWKTPLGSGAWGYQREVFQAAYDTLTGAPAEPSEADLAAARALIADIRDTLPPLVIAGDGTSTRNVIASALVDAAEQIGLRAEIHIVPPQQYGDFYTDKTLREQADFWIDEYYISKNDPIGFYKNGASTARVNFIGFSDPAYDAKVKLAQRTVDDKARAALVNDLQARWVQAALWIPVVQSPATLAMSDAVTGAPSSAAYLYYPWAVALGSTEKR